MVKYNKRREMDNTQSNPTEPQISEFKLRQLAGLCQLCGLARKYGDSTECEECFKAADTRAMEKRWRKWGIAA